MTYKTLSAGVALALAVAVGHVGAAQASTNLVTNGGFETGDFTGWAPAPNSFPMYIVSAPVQEGAHAAQIAGFDFNPDTLTQVILTALGQSYTLSFWYAQDQRTPNGLAVTWNGANVYAVTDELIGGYQHVLSTVVGTGSDNLVFSAYNNPAYTYLDNVSVSANVPEPSTWALSIVGFGLLGATVRRRRQQLAATA